MSPGKLETILQIPLATSLIDGAEHASNAVQAVRKPVAFSLVSCMVIVTEFSINPSIVRTWVGMKIDFSGCTTRPKLSNNTVVSITLLTQSS